MYPAAQNFRFDRKVNQLSDVRAFAIDFPGGGGAGKGLEDTPEALATSQNFSLCIWLNPDILSGVQAVSSYHNGFNNGWTLATTGSNLRLGDDGGVALTSSLTLSVGVWSFVAISNGSANGYKVYKANFGESSLAEDSTTERTFSFTGSRFSIGRIFGETNTAWNGQIAEVGYWTTELSTAQVGDLFAAGAGVRYSQLSGLGLTANLESYWGLQDASGGAVDEHSTNNLSEAGTTGSLIYQVAGPS